MRAPIFFTIGVLAAGCAHPPPVVEESINQRTMEDVGREHNHDVLNCYQARLKEKPNLEGELILNFSVKPDGQIANAEIKRSVDKAVDECVLKEAKAWKFPWNVRENNKTTMPMTDKFKLTRDNGQPKSEFSESQQEMDKDGIRKTIRNHLRDVRVCYEARLKDKKDLNGKVVLEWEIGNAGQVDDVKIKQSFDKVLDQCIVDTLKTWRFPVPPKDVVGRVSYPFVFSQ